MFTYPADKVAFHLKCLYLRQILLFELIQLYPDAFPHPFEELTDNNSTLIYTEESLSMSYMQLTVPELVSGDPVVFGCKVWAAHFVRIF